jgi:hypothetical protein
VAERSLGGPFPAESVFGRLPPILDRVSVRRACLDARASDDSARNAFLAVSFISLLDGVQARTQRALPNQALDCVDHKHGPDRKLDQIPVENPVSITGGSGSNPDR